MSALFSDEDWSETEAVIAYITAHLPSGALMDWETVDKALSSRRTIRDALRWKVVSLEKALGEAVAKIPPPPPPPRPRPFLALLKRERQQ